MTDNYDAFISHTFDDKDAIARPLAQRLSDYGLNIWYDEFTLEVGDSLIESIDKGLARSNFGIVILSKSFLSKGWTKYELRGLLTREIGQKKVVLPIWHNISRDEIIEISPTLADKYALNTSNQSLNEISALLIKVIRPDIFENMSRYVAWLRAKKAGTLEYKTPAEFRKLKPGRIRHATLPGNILVRLKLVHEVLKKVINTPFPDFVENFQRDVHPQDEITIWERIAVAYLGLTSKKTTIREREYIFTNLLAVSMEPKESLLELLKKNDENAIEFIAAYVNAMPKMDDIIKKKVSD